MLFLVHFCGIFEAVVVHVLVRFCCIFGAFLQHIWGIFVPFSVLYLGHILVRFCGIFASFLGLCWCSFRCIIIILCISC